MAGKARRERERTSFIIKEEKVSETTRVDPKARFGKLVELIIYSEGENRERGGLYLEMEKGYC